MSFLKNTLKDDKTSQFVVDNLMCGHDSITYPQFLQIFGHDPVPNADAGFEKKRAMTATAPGSSSNEVPTAKNRLALARQLPCKRARLGQMRRLP